MTTRIKNLVLLVVFLSLISCQPEQNYRGVPSPTWKHLTAEQKQLIVDRAYEDEKSKDE